MASTRPQDDPMRNFKFQVSISGAGAQNIANMGFTNVSGLSMNTEMIPYREGGWNTNFHKLPGQTDFGPLSLVQGIMSNRRGVWDLARNIFALQQGQAQGPGLAIGTDFRYTTVIRVLDHPVTIGDESGMNGSPAGARLAFVVYNCWTGTVTFNDLDASGNAVLISQMTMHHEGFDVIYGADAATAA
jgi:phage tail-like protein